MTTQQTPPEPTAPGDGPAGAPGRSAPRWVVGVDGSPGARAALVWALGAAARAGATLELTSSYPVDVFWMDPHLVDPRRLDGVREQTEVRVRELLAEVRQDPAVSAVPGAAEVTAEVVIAAGAPAEHLIARAAGAALLVVGSRGRGGVRSTLLGSVALHCVTQAPCPVVVVRPAAVQPPPRVVVGLDDSAMSRAALARAAAVARTMQAELDVVAVYQPMVLWGDVSPVIVPPLGKGFEQAEARARAIVAEVLEEDAVLAVRVRVEVGSPGEALVRAADGAALLVVGSRSSSRLAGMLLGSVALHCAVHAPGPVLVVHPDRTTTATA